MKRKPVTHGNITFPFVRLSGKEGDAHRQEIFAVPGDNEIKGRHNAQAAARSLDIQTNRKRFKF
tara:strand:+ start:116 stop:307 length:192 start_codon:yes stop_codon:yes gene_type:complete